MMLQDWNDTAHDYSENLTVQAMFEAQARRTPDAVAMFDEQGQVTFGELERHANQLARYLHKLGVRPGTLVGISLPRCIDLVVSLLAILKAGGAYIPLDPNFPSDRLTYMLQDSGARILLTQNDLAPLFSTDQIAVVSLDRVAPAIAQFRAEHFDGGAGPDHTAYVIYTSGSTGRPKGVQVLQTRGSEFPDLDAEPARYFC